MSTNEKTTLSQNFWDWMQSYWHTHRDFPPAHPDWRKKADLVNGKVPAGQLPSYVDDVLEFSKYAELPQFGEKGKIYITTEDNKQFRWSGSVYLEINATSNLNPADYVTLDTAQNVTGKKRFDTIYNSYTPDGLFDPNAKPLSTNTPGGKNLLFGYKDYGSGQYYPRIGFTSDTNWSLGAIGNNFTIGTNNDGSAQLRLTPSGVLKINDGEVFTTNNLDLNNYISTSHAANQITENEIIDWRSYLRYIDNRSIKAVNILPTKLQFGFTSWNNNNTYPWADYIHFGGYGDATGGSQNLLVFKKNGFGLRQYQNTFQNQSEYQSYTDYWNTDNLNPVTLNTAQTIDSHKTFTAGLKSTTYEWFGLAMTAPGKVSKESTFYNLGSDFGYGISTNVIGGLDIMANQAGQPIRFWAGNDNDNPFNVVNFYKDIVKYFTNISINEGKEIRLKGEHDIAHHVKHFADDTDGFGVSTGFSVKPYHDASQNLLLVDDSGTYVKGNRVWDKGNFNPEYKAERENNAVGIGFYGGELTMPFIRHNYGISYLFSAKPMEFFGSGKNVNDIERSGFYAVGNGTLETGNYSGSEDGKRAFLHLETENIHSASQIQTERFTGNILSRTKADGLWSDWIRHWGSNDFTADNIAKWNNSIDNSSASEEVILEDNILKIQPDEFLLEGNGSYEVNSKKKLVHVLFKDGTDLNIRELVKRQTTVVFNLSRFSVNLNVEGLKSYTLSPEMQITLYVTDAMEVLLYNETGFKKMQ